MEGLLYHCFCHKTERTARFGDLTFLFFRFGHQFAKGTPGHVFRLFPTHPILFSSMSIYSLDGGYSNRTKIKFGADLYRSQKYYKHPFPSTTGFLITGERNRKRVQKLVTQGLADTCPYLFCDLQQFLSYLFCVKTEF